jgi:DNA-binding response OmpR family regulator
MDEPPSDGKENVIDIFILSTDETVALQLTGLLEQRDYQVTVFTDGAQLKETLRAGKPNLLICDSSIEEQEGFEVCRQIKADDDLWVIPVLILTAATTIGDLLKVLDSNADNFIAQPYDLPYHLLLIEGMLATPVERQTPDEIKTQFKISHDDRTYVVAANRRKLLEYLLSVFEIVVNKSSELSHLTSELRELSESVKELEKSVTGHTHVIEILNATIQLKERKIIALTQECEELEQALVQKTDEIGNLVQERDVDKALITTHDETIRVMIREREELGIAHRSTTDALTSRISALVAESDTRKTSLDTVQRALSEETTRSASLEKTLRALTLEHEQQKSAFAAEKNRAMSAEQEIVAVIQAKTQSEQDLTRIITDLNETAKQQAAELTRLKGEMEAETNRRVLTEKQGVSLQREFEQSESSFHAEMDALNREIGKLQEMLTDSAAALEKETGITKLQKEHLAGVIAEKEKTEDRLESVSSQLAESQAAVASGEQKRRSLVDNLEEVIAEKEKTEDRLESAVQELAEAQAAVASGEQKRRSLADTLEKTVAEKEKSEQKANTLSTALDNAQSEIEAERGQHRTVEEILDRTTRERDNALGTLRQEYDGVQTDLDSHKVSLAQREHDLDATTAIRVTLERDLDAVKTRNRVLEEDISLAAQYRVQSGQQSRSLADELEQVKAALETERRLRRIAEEKTKSAAQQHEDLDQHLRTANEEMERAKKDRAATFRQFKEELETAGHQIKSLEAHVSTLTREKLHAEQDVQALTTELEHARTALADERESHRDVDERHTAAGNERFRMQQSLSRADGGDTPKENVQLVISKEPNLPVPVEHVSQSLTTEITPGLQQSPVPRKDPVSGGPSVDIPRVFSGVIPHVSGISGADNIFLENEPVAKKVDPAPGPAKANDSAEEKTVEEYSPEKSPAADDEKEQSASDDDAQPEKDDEAGPEDAGDEEGPEDAGDEVAYDGESDETPGEPGGPIPLGGISFSRNQWLDLLKWSHHSGAISQDQRLKIVRMGRLVQKDRKLTKKQQDQIREIIALVYALGYRPQ